MLTWLPFSADSAAMVCSAQKVKVAVKSAKIGASSHVTNSILKNAAKWLVYASTVTYMCCFFYVYYNYELYCYNSIL